ncbi:MAG: penicillin acylase family protein [Rhodospirillaceae bacterium]
MIWLKRITLLFICLVVLVIGSASWLTWQSLPRVSGDITLPGPEANIDITRDHNGIPYIQAQNEGDAYFAVGYVHAQDRLFQMEFMRRLGAGRLAEILGKQALGSDQFMRTLGLYGYAEQNVTALSPETRMVLERYAAGVNAWLATRQQPLPPEFQLLQFTPEPWRPADSMVWQKLMSLSLAGNWRDELLRAKLLKLLPPQRVAELWPDLVAGSPTTLAAHDFNPAQVAGTLIELIDAYAPPTLASNIWALSGEHTNSGKPLLASDPHLGYQAPIIWYLARLEWPGQFRGELGSEVRSGATTPGVPFTIIGHNMYTAWGMTTTHADLQDLFIEKLTADGGYETPSGSAMFEERTEVINVRFSDPVTLRVRRTRHGPVVSDLAAFQNGDSPQDTVLALAATMLRDDDRTANAVYDMSKSRSVGDTKEALSQFEGPQQNFMYADRFGGIGFSAPALVPIRASGDGTVPVPGWSGEYDWQGWVPYEELPHSMNPASGRLVNANNRPVPEDYPYLIAASFPAGYRAERIDWRLNELAQKQAKWQDMLSIQTDAVSTAVHDILPRLLNVTRSENQTTNAVLTALHAWDGAMDRARPEPLIFLSWIDFLKEGLLKDDLGEAYASLRGVNPVLLRNILTGQSNWCDNVLSAPKEDCGQIASQALEKALKWLSERDETTGADPLTWRWGDFHRAQFAHPLFGMVPGLSALTTVEIEADGSDNTVNRGGYRSARGRAPFLNTHGAGLRAIFDLENLDQSRFITAVGQSGHPASPHYDDLNESWRDGGMLTLPPAHTLTNAEKLTLLPLAKAIE